MWTPPNLPSMGGDLRRGFLFIGLYLCYPNYIIVLPLEGGVREGLLSERFAQKLDFDGWADGSDEESTYYDFPNSMIIEIGGFDYANGVCNRDVYTRECSSPALYYIYYGHNVHPVGSQDIIALYDAITYGNLNGYELSLSFTYPL